VGISCEGYFLEFWWDENIPRGLFVGSGGPHKHCCLDLGTCLPQLVNVVCLEKLSCLTPEDLNSRLNCQSAYGWLIRREWCSSSPRPAGSLPRRS
jgi:hypothetical protein